MKEPEFFAGQKVLIETKFCGISLEDSWYPDYEATVVEETENRVCVKRHWWSKKEWPPKNGSLLRVMPVLYERFND